MTVITISREYGSGGRKIAARVCELEGLRFFDKQLIARAATEIGMGEEDVADYPELEYKERRLHERLMDIIFGHGSTGKGTRITTPKLAWGGLEARLDQDWFVQLVNKTILAAYEEGDVVILGRGGQAVLKDQPGVLHVRIQASMDMRMWRLQEIEGMNYDKAQRLIEEHDKSSAAYLQRFFGVKWNDPMLYHLIINTSKIQPMMAAQIIIDAAHQIELEAVAG
jgi:cytidylate kinase